MELAADFGQDYKTLLPRMRNSVIRIKDTDYDRLDIACISDLVEAGEPLPVEYCEAEIKGILVGIRRHRLCPKCRFLRLACQRKRPLL